VLFVPSEVDVPPTLREPPAIQAPAKDLKHAPGFASVRAGVGGGLATKGVGGLVFAAAEGWPVRWLGVGGEILGGGIYAHDSVSWRSYRGRLALRVPANSGSFHLGSSFGPAERKVSGGDRACSNYPDSDCPGGISHSRTYAVGMDAGWVYVSGLAELGVGGRIEATQKAMVLALCLTAGLDFGAR
jgi:hypothetical protein